MAVRKMTVEGTGWVCGVGELGGGAWINQPIARPAGSSSHAWAGGYLSVPLGCLVIKPGVDPVTPASLGTRRPQRPRAPRRLGGSKSLAQSGTKPPRPLSPLTPHPRTPDRVIETRGRGAGDDWRLVTALYSHGEETGFIIQRLRVQISGWGIAVILLHSGT